MSGLWALLCKQLGRTWATAAALLAILILTLGPLVTAYQMGWNARDRAATAEAQEERIERLQRLLRASSEVQVAVGDYILRRGEDRIVIRTLKQEVPRVVTVYKPSPAAPAEPLPHCVFTRGFVRVWNDGMRDPGSSGRGDGAAAAGGAATAEDLLVADIGQADVLDNHLDNAAVMRELREQLLLAQAYIKTTLQGAP